MHRRHLLDAAAALPLLARARAAPSQRLSRVRPSDPEWPAQTSWQQLNHDTQGRLIRVQSPLTVCQEAPDGAECRDLFKELKNPYFIGDTVGADPDHRLDRRMDIAAERLRRCGRDHRDVVAAVNFARQNNLRLVIRGGGHSYLGTSNAPDSLLIWTRRMNDITLHDAFVAQGCAGRAAPQPAVTVGAGAIWMHTYNAVTTKGGRYVQGGGCGTVGVAGLVQGGGFGSYSKFYGTAGAALLEAEIVTADGEVRIANACTHRRPVLGAEGRRRRQLRRRHPADTPHARAADVLRLRECDDPGIVRGGVSQIDSAALSTSMPTACSTRTGARSSHCGQAIDWKSGWLSRGWNDNRRKPSGNPSSNG